MRDSKRTMNLKDKLYMPPLEKYKFIGLFPWKIAVHLVLMVFATCQVILVLNHTAMYSLEQYRLWNVLFLDKAANGSSPSITNSYDLFSLSALLTYVQETVGGYYDVNDSTLANYEFLWEDGVKKPPRMYVEYLDQADTHNGTWLNEYNLTRISLGPLSSQSAKSFVGRVRHFSIDFSLKHNIPDELNLFSTCYQWVITQTYDFSSRGPINVSLNPQRKKCDDSARKLQIADFLAGYIWISIGVAFLALVSFCLTWHSLMQRTVIIARLQGMEVARRDAWENLDFSTKLKFFNFWVVVQILGNLCQFFGAILAFVDLDAYIELQETLTGFGCFFAWVNVVGYLPHNSVSYTIINTLKRGLPVIIPYVVGILPIFMAYAFLGVALFWPTSYFPDPMMSMVVLFALINGDTVYVFSSAMADTYYFLGQLYFFTFLVFFIW